MILICITFCFTNPITTVAYILYKYLGRNTETTYYSGSLLR